MKKTKIVCTIGPASWEEDVLTQMVEAGMNVARINGAFADVPELERVEKLIRGVSQDVALMLDIKGTEVRLNKFGEAFMVEEGDIVEIGNSEEHKIYPRTYPELINDLTEGDHVLFDDGNVEAVLKEKQNGVMMFEVIRGGKFKEGKSINTPGINLSNPPLTDRDREQIAYCTEAKWEFVAASFIRNKEDAQLVKDTLEGSPLKLIAKIENEEGVNNIDEILEVVDGVMVARGDMGVEMPFEKIPFVQKELIYKCNMAGKPVITATQMLESMVENDRPTRAEITDVANAIIDGTDAIMLSAESSAGKYPVQAVQTMTRIATEVEKDFEPQFPENIASGDIVADALTKAAYQVATQLGSELKAVVTISRTISRLLSTCELEQPIISFVENDTRRRQIISLTYGINDVMLGEDCNDRDTAVNALVDKVRGLEQFSKGDKILVLGYSLHEQGDFPKVFEVVEL